MENERIAAAFRAGYRDHEDKRWPDSLKNFLADFPTFGERKAYIDGHNARHELCVVSHWTGSCRL